MQLQDTLIYQVHYDAAALPPLPRHSSLPSPPPVLSETPSTFNTMQYDYTRE